MPDAPVNSWDMIFKPEVIAKFADCGVHVLDSPDDLIPAALNYLGLDPNSKDPGELQKAGDLLKSIRPSIQKFHSSEYINALANGDICMAVGYSGDVLQARDRAAEAGNNINIVYSIPKEGALMWLDAMSIPADAPHPDEAHAFINFMLKPEIAAREFQLHLLRQRQSRLAGAARRGGAQRQGHLPGRGDDGQALHDDGGRSAPAAGDHAHLDGSEDRPVRFSVRRSGRRRARPVAMRTSMRSGGAGS